MKLRPKGPEKNFRRPVPPHLPLSKGLDDRPHPISQGLNPVLTVPFYVCEKVQKTFWFCDLFIYKDKGLKMVCESGVRKLLRHYRGKTLHVI